MPQKGQVSITMSKKDMTEKLLKYAEDNERTMSNVVRLCILSYFGTEEEIVKSTTILGDAPDG